MKNTIETAPTTIEVSPERLQTGYWCHAENKTLDQGDIYAAYSTDLIGMEGRVRSPFRLQGWLCVTASYAHRPAPQATAYRLAPPAMFAGEQTTYREKLLANGGEDARRDPNGFYHGMRVRQGKQEYILVGPAITIVAGAPEPTQAELF